jgi:galactose mutarotase-like enzyme
MENIVLEDDRGNVAVIAPQLGGWLLRYACQTEHSGLVEVLHFPAGSLDLYPAMPGGCHLMFPVAGYTTNEGKPDRYRWQGREYAMPVHGFARRSPWTVQETTKTAVTLTLDSNETSRVCYPFEFRLTLKYELAAGCLRARFEVQNFDDRAMPFSAGFHPYLRAPMTVRGSRELSYALFPAAREYRLTPTGIAMDAAQPRRLSTSTTASPARHFGAFADFKAELSDAMSEVSVLIEADLRSRYRFFTVWSPTSDAPFYCIEPRTAMPDVFSRAVEDQLTVLPPTANFSGEMTLRVLENCPGAATELGW